MTWQMFIGHAVFIASILVTALIVIAFKVAHMRQRKRSPLHGKQLGHVPGQQLLKRIDGLDREVVFGMDVMMLALPIMFMVWATGSIDWSRFRFGVIESIFAVGWLLFFAYGFWVYQRHYRRREQVRDGLLAERVTGMQLNRLVASGCTVLHDLPAEGFNIDHVVIAPRGVYAVETKSVRKPKGEGKENSRVRFDGRILHFPHFAKRDAIEQAERQAQWLARDIRQGLGMDVPVIAALALPGWYVEQDLSVWRGATVKVFSPMGEGCNFMTKGPEALDATQRSLIAKALALRFPKVED